MKKLLKVSFKEKNQIKQLFVLIVFWRITLFLFQLLGMRFLDFKPKFSFTQVSPEIKRLFAQWGNFDGLHYSTILGEGYLKTGFIQAFFPFYPLLAKPFYLLFRNLLLSGLLVSHLSFLGALWVFYHLIRLDFSKKIAFQTILFLLVFPTSFFFGAFYNESLFLLLVFASFYLMRKKNWLGAAFLASLASATKIIGLFLLPALVWEWWQQKDKAKSLKAAITKKAIISFLIAPSGWLFYSLYLQKHFGDFFLYAHVQGAYGAQRTTGKIILLYQVFWRYLKMLLTVQRDSWLYYAVALEFLAALGFLGLLLLAFKKSKKIRLSYLIYAIPAYFLPTLTGTFSSMPRYVLVLFPAFIVLGQINNKKLISFLLLVFTFLLAVSTALFTQGYWLS